MPCAFEKELRASITPELLSDAKFCDGLYAAMCNMAWARKEWTREEKLTKFWSCSWRASGEIVAELRNDILKTSENYLDFYCSGNEGRVDERIREFFGSFGWEPVSWDDIEAQNGTE